MADTLGCGGSLGPGGSLTAPNCAYNMQMQGDGNLVVRTNTYLLLSIYSISSLIFMFFSLSFFSFFSGFSIFQVYDSGGGVHWQSGTAGTCAGGTLTNQGDGNLVIYVNGAACWDTHTDGHGCSVLAMQVDGNLVMYDSNHNPTWHCCGGDGQGPGNRCPVNCEVSAWSCSACTRPCAGGTQSCDRSVTVQPANGGAECPALAETQSCNAQPCPIDCEVSAWSSWSNCSRACGGGTDTRTRTVTVEPRNGGTACPALSESKSCNTQPCPIECRVGNWSAWSACDRVCGGGVERAERNVTVEPRFDGAACPELNRSRSCNSQPCPIDCIVGNWSAWSACPCGGGEQVSTRTIIVEAAFNGTACPPRQELTRSQACAFRPCPRPTPMPSPSPSPSPSSGASPSDPPLDPDGIPIVDCPAPGYYQPILSKANASAAAVDNSTAPCLPCPAGNFCPTGGDAPLPCALAATCPSRAQAAAVVIAPLGAGLAWWLYASTACVLVVCRVVSYQHHKAAAGGEPAEYVAPSVALSKMFAQRFMSREYASIEAEGDVVDGDGVGDGNAGATKYVELSDESVGVALSSRFRTVTPCERVWLLTEFCLKHTAVYVCSFLSLYVYLALWSAAWQAPVVVRVGTPVVLFRPLLAHCVALEAVRLVCAAAQASKSRQVPLSAANVRTL